MESLRCMLDLRQAEIPTLSKQNAELQRENDDQRSLSNRVTLLHHLYRPVGRFVLTTMSFAPCHQLQQVFWTRWREEYLTLLQKRSKWRTPDRRLQVIDLVLVKDENLPPLRWPLARVMSLIPGKDDECRVAELKTTCGSTRRAINKLCPLPLKMMLKDSLSTAGGFQGRKDSTSLIEAAASGHCDIVIVLLKNNFNVNASCENGDTALMVASAGGYVNVVNALLSHGANVKEHNLIEHTPLMKAACAGHVEVAKVLVERGAGINTRSNVYNESALSVASYKSHFDSLVRFLPHAGADRLNFALSAASTYGQVEVARLLLDSGAQVNISTYPLPSPLACSINNGHVEVATLLIEFSANINGAITKGYTYLMMAACKGAREW
ncbi:ankyrin repeat and KH domain-containing protein mask-like [Drosophila nasuta]|uniref:ankyrin repeat and KH domain-containing protein mask-like n=1 Tax=Drosophila nasuta TaxID=42062 RepID=UPI00295E6DBC|nr:ankyrin repeat and KH domain-containing protein mask-like [Drosophila nasuta]